jgi:hypothetical protein
MVFSNFNMEQFMAHATTGTRATRAEPQQGNDDEVLASGRV